jgi:16S rRNA G527 N7-methylase RsmG
MSQLNALSKLALSDVHMQQFDDYFKLLRDNNANYLLIFIENSNLMIIIKFKLIEKID